MTVTSPSLKPVIQPAPIAWVRKNLFNSWFNSILTIVLGGILLWIAYTLIAWALTTAQWQVLSANLPL